MVATIHADPLRKDRCLSEVARPVASSMLKPRTLVQALLHAGGTHAR